jgi:hypothetical protein
MIADIALPPFTTILLALGALLILLGLTGRITLKQVNLGISQLSLRVLSGIIGAGLIGIAIWLFVFPVASSQSSSPGSTSPTPGATALSVGKTIPLERYNELTGKWEIIETVVPPYGDYEIIWSYEASVLGNRLTMQGKKQRINERQSVRPLRADEKGTVSIYTLDLVGLEAEGKASEKDQNGVIVSTVKIHFSEDLKSLSGTFQTGGSQVSTLMGSRQQ